MEELFEKRAARPRGTDSAKLIQVIVTESIAGRGITEDDPVRTVKQYWSTDGELLAINDPWARFPEPPV